jgi:hypothetical protein
MRVDLSSGGGSSRPALWGASYHTIPQGKKKEFMLTRNGPRHRHRIEPWPGNVQLTEWQGQRCSSVSC